MCMCVCDHNYMIVLQQHALLKQNEIQLLDTASKCKAVICCRVTPLQKVYSLHVVYSSCTVNFVALTETCC